MMGPVDLALSVASALAFCLTGLASLMLCAGRLPGLPEGARRALPVLSVLLLLLALSYVDVKVVDLAYGAAEVREYWFSMWQVGIQFLSSSIALAYLSFTGFEDPEAVGRRALALLASPMILLYGLWFDHVYFLLKDYSYWLSDGPLPWLPHSNFIPNFSTYDATLLFNLPSLLALILLWRWAVREY